MNLEQLIGRHLRLREDLAIAASSVPWNSGHVDRITAELNAVEDEIAALQAHNDLTNATTHRFPFFPLSQRVTGGGR
jgi:hypothetical protein